MKMERSSTSREVSLSLLISVGITEGRRLDHGNKANNHATIGVNERLFLMKDLAFIEMAVGRKNG
jgi:hypothetical protein